MSELPPTGQGGSNLYRPAGKNHGQGFRENPRISSFFEVMYIIAAGMAKTVSVATARSTLSQLIDEVDAGELVTITRHGRPIVDLVPTGTPPPARPRKEFDLEAWLIGELEGLK